MSLTLRHGGATAGNRPATASEPPPSSSPATEKVREKGEMSLSLERERVMDYEEINRSHVFIKPFEPFFLSEPVLVSFKP